MQKITVAVLMFLAASGAPRAWASQAPGAPVVDPSLALAGPSDAGAANPDNGIVADPHADRGILMPTALTQPAGTVSISSYELLAAGITVGITDRLQASVSGLLIPFFDAQMFMGNLKYQVLRRGAWRLALNGGVLYTRTREDAYFHRDGSDSVDHRFGPYLGTSASLCLTDDCQSLLSGSVQFLPNADARPLSELSVAYAGSLIVRLAQNIKLVLEATSNAQLVPAIDQSASALYSGALRFFNAYLALDAGIMTMAETGSDLTPLPFIAGSLRF